MLYWIILITLFIVLIGILFFIWKKRMWDRDMDREVFGGLVFIICVLMVFIIPLSIDIPDAIKGGQEMYVDKLPSYSGYGRFRRVITDNDKLSKLTGCNWSLYEQYGNYHIRYTKFTKFVLDVEKLD